MRVEVLDTFFYHYRAGRRLPDLRARISVQPEEDVSLDVVLGDAGGLADDVGQLQLAKVLDVLVGEQPVRRDGD